MNRAVIAFALLGYAPAGPVSDLQPEFRGLLSRELRFSPADLADLQKGKVVTHGLGASSPGEIAAVGAVRIAALRSAFVERYRDIEHFKQGPDVLQIGRFSTSPTAEDLEPLTLEKEDLDVRGCRVANCDIRLSEAIILRFRQEIDWKARDAERLGHCTNEVMDEVRAKLAPLLGY